MDTLIPVQRWVVMETERRHASGVLLVLAAAILWGSLGPVSRVALAEGMEPLAVAFWRATFGWVFFAAHAGAQRSLVIARHDIALVVLFGLVSVSGFYGSYQLAVLFGGAARAAVLLYTAPVWVAGLAIAFLGERLRRRTAAGILVSLSGVALISVSSGGETGVPAGMTGTGGGLGILFGLIAGFTYALYYILGRRLLGRYRSTTLFSWILAIGALGLFPFISPVIPSVRAAVALVFLGLVATYLAYLCYSAGVVRLLASESAVIATAEPVVAAVLAYIFWGERLGVAGSIGAALVLGGVLTQVLRR
jgi:DME family drug/metabolite transporter